MLVIVLTQKKSRRYIHRDLACRNVLLASIDRIKVSKITKSVLIHIVLKPFVAIFHVQSCCVIITSGLACPLVYRAIALFPVGSFRIRKHSQNGLLDEYYNNKYINDDAFKDCAD